MTRKAFIEDGMAELLTELGGKVFEWWNGVEIECIPSTLERGLPVVVGGKEVTVDLSLYVLKRVFISADSTLITADMDSWTADDNKPHPLSGRKLRFGGRQYRVATVAEDSTRAYYKILCVDENSGR